MDVAFGLSRQSMQYLTMHEANMCHNDRLLFL
jgi:hypothetical protein